MSDARLAVLDRRRHEDLPGPDLVAGTQCGGDAFSGVTANPALGFAVDLLVRAGAGRRRSQRQHRAGRRPVRAKA
jgi:galactarate dehydratase